MRDEPSEAATPRELRAFLRFECLGRQRGGGAEPISP